MKKKFSPRVATTLQITVALLLCVSVLLCLRLVESEGILSIVGASSIGSTIFILLSRPHCETAKLRRVILSYCIGLAVGLLYFYGSRKFVGVEHVLRYDHVYIITGGLALATTMLSLIVLDLNHPPAVGLSLGVVIDHWDGWLYLTILACVVMICIIERLLRPWLRNLRYRAYN